MDEARAGRADRDRDQRADRGDRDREHEWPAARAHHWAGLVLEVGARDDLPGAFARLVLIGELDPGEVDLHVTVSRSWSSPRRRRELTVPRGRSSSSAISPGV